MAKAKKKTAQRSSYRLIQIEIEGDGAGFDVALIDALGLIRQSSFGGPAIEEKTFNVAGADVRVRVERQ